MPDTAPVPLREVTRVQDLHNDTDYVSSLTDAENEAAATSIGTYVSEEPISVLAFIPLESKHVDENGRVSGYVLAVDGATRVQGPNPFISAATGTGISMWHVRGQVDERAFLETFSAVGQTASSHLATSAPGMQVMLAKSQDDYDTDYWVLARGNCQRAADELLTSAQGQSVHEIVESGEYKQALRASEQLRDDMIKDWAATHKLQLAGDRETSIPTHYIVHSPIASTSGIGALDAGRQVYVVYNDAIDPAAAKSGALLYRGPMGDLKWLRAPETNDGVGNRSHAFTNSTHTRPFSLLPAHTGYWSEGRLAARHRYTSAKTQEQAMRRMNWAGVTSAYNPAADQVFNGDDATWLQVQSRLGITPESGITATNMQIVATTLPEFTVTKLSLPQLVGILDKSGESALPIRTDGPIVAQLQRNWPQLKAKLGPSATLASVLAKEHDDIVVVNAEVLRALMEF